MQSKPLSLSTAPARPDAPNPPVVSRPATAPGTVQPTARDHLERAGESIKDAAHDVAEGIRQPIARLGEKIRGGVVEGAQAYDQPFLNLLNRYETVFVLDDSSTLTANDWERVKAALFQMVPLALLHNAAGGVPVYNASGEGVMLRTREEVGNYVLSMMQQSTQPADVSALVQNTLADRMGKIGEAGAHPLNLIVVSNRLPDAAAEQALVHSAKATHDAKIKHPLRVQYSVTRDDAASQGAAKTFADGFAAAHDVDSIFDAATIPYGPAFHDLAVQQLVGKIGTWAVDSVAN